MGKRKKDRTAEVLEELVEIIRAKPDGVIDALNEGRASEELTAVSAIKCKRGTDGGCEWEIKLVDKLKAIELYLKYGDGHGEEREAPTSGFVVDYDYG
ncbi:MAG: hypothetical protein J6D21_11995 [Clostridia bacterium]|nr:hypothetical protein [Clostridia bacterium]